MSHSTRLCVVGEKLVFIKREIQTLDDIKSFDKENVVLCVCHYNNINVIFKI